MIEDNTVIDTKNMTKKTIMIITNENNECQENEKFIEDDTVFATGYLEITTNNTVDN